MYSHIPRRREEQIDQPGSFGTLWESLHPTSGWSASLTVARIPKISIRNYPKIFLQTMPHSLTAWPADFARSAKITSLAFLPVSIDNLCDVLTWTPQLKLLFLDNDPDLSHISEAQCHRLALMSSFILPCLGKLDTRISLKAFEALWCTKSRSPVIDTYTAHSIDCSEAAPEIDENQFYQAVENLFHYHGDIANDVDDVRWSLVIYPSTIEINVTANSPSLARNLKFSCTDAPSDTVLAILRSFIPHMKNATDFLLLVETRPQFLLKELAQSCRSMTKVLNISVSRESLQWYNYVERSEGLLFPLLRQLDSWNNDESNVYL